MIKLFRPSLSALVPAGIMNIRPANSRTRRWIGTLLVITAATHISSAQAAPLGDRLRLGAELGGGTLLTSYQRSTLQYGNDLQASIFAGLAMTETADIELTLRDWWFPSDLGYGRATLIGAGGRVWFLSGERGAAFANADLGLGRNGDTSRFMFDVGAGYAFHLGHGLDLGPALRYCEIVTAGTDAPHDPRFWSLGVALFYRGQNHAPIGASNL